MIDRGSGGFPLESAWRAISHRLAVIGGSLAGLMSLLHHAPIPTAALRGLATYVAVLCVSRLGLAALERATVLDGHGRGKHKSTKG